MHQKDEVSASIAQNQQFKEAANQTSSSSVQFLPITTHLLGEQYNPQVVEQHAPPQISLRLQDPRLLDVDRGTKLEVGDFKRDNNPEIFLDWLHSLESLFRCYRLEDEQKVFFVEANLKGKTRFWR